MMLVMLLGTTSILSSCGKDDEGGENKPDVTVDKNKDDVNENGDKDDNTQPADKYKTPAGLVAVDLGLSVKWANMNVGAKTPESYGLYFAWGETTGYGQDTSDGHSFDWANYKWCNGSITTMTKYCINSDYGTVDDKSTLDPEDDAATANWGGTWRMPTEAELNEFCNNCTWTWTTQNSVKGYKVVGKNGNSIFLPAAGYRYDSFLRYDGSFGFYRSSSVYSNRDCYHTHYLFLDSDDCHRWSDGSRPSGYSVRAVCP